MLIDPIIKHMVVRSDTDPDKQAEASEELPDDVDESAEVTEPVEEADQERAEPDSVETEVETEEVETEEVETEKGE
jgi:hypothetical protein